MSLGFFGSTSQRPIVTWLPNTWSATQTFAGIVTDSIQAATSAGIVLKSLSGSTVVTLGPGSGQSAAFSDGISCANGTFAGTAPGTPTSGQVLIGGGEVKAGAGITCTTLTASGLIRCNASGNNGVSVDAGGGESQIYFGRTAGIASIGTLNAYDFQFVVNGLQALLINQSTRAATFASSVSCTSLTPSGDISQTGGQYHYLRGDASTDGSVRFSSQSSGTMLIEKRASGAWTSIGSFA
jgi:hypothetical protein